MNILKRWFSPSRHTGISDVLTSGIDPSDHLALVDPGLGLAPDVTAGTVDVTVNTFTDTMDPALDSSFTIPFTDPLLGIWARRFFHSASDRFRSNYSTPTASMMFSRAARRAGGSEPSRLIASAPTVNTSAIGLGRKPTVKFIMSPLTRL